MATETDTIPANQCLAIIPSASNPNIYNGKLETCGSNDEPPAEQVFLYQENDFGNLLLFVRLLSGSDSPR